MAVIVCGSAPPESKTSGRALPEVSEVYQK
jgi:hypothetical protein